MINIDGLKLYPQELEHILLSHPMVKDVGVCAIKDDITFHQIGVAVVTKDDTINKKSFTNELYKLLEKKLHIDQTNLYKFKIPKKIYFEKTIPRTDLGKIKRDILSINLEKNTDPYYYKKEQNGTRV